MTGRGIVCVVTGRYGLVAYFVHDEWHGCSLREYAEWSEAEVALWRKLIRLGDVAVDVGAHIGTHTLAFASLVGPEGQVHAFEPQEAAVVLLRRNVEQNGLRNVTVSPGALGAQPGTLRYDDPVYWRTGNFGGVELGPSGKKLAQVRTLDAARLGRVDFVKVDVEGMEQAVLAGAAGTIRRCLPILYVENDRPELSDALITTLRGFGYNVWWHLPPLFNPDNFARNRNNVFPGVVSLNLLALPQGRDEPQDLWLRPLDAVRFRADGAVEYS